MRVLYFIQYLLFLVFFIPIAILPYSLSLRLGRILGNLGYFLFAKRRVIALENIKNALDKGTIQYTGGPEAMAREVFRNLGQWFVEIVKVLFGFGGNLVKRIRVEGLENLEVAPGDTRGILVVSAHVGNWELMVMSLTEKLGCTMHGLAKKQNNPYINDFIVKARQKYGTRILYKKGVLRKFISILREGGAVGMMLDQHVSANMGYRIDFLGSPAWVSRTPATIARKTGARLVPLFLHYDMKEKLHVLTIMPEIPSGEDMEDTTRQLNSRVEEFIKRCPAQWLWIHRRWKKDPSAPGEDEEDLDSL
ncbi:lysophospholipid acyltransferase family protein [Nitrospirota bacterium]